MKNYKLKKEIVPFFSKGYEKIVYPLDKWLSIGLDINALEEEIKENIGDGNSGDGNSGYRNSGDFNSGNGNSGNGNSGDGNRGYRNSGGYNRGDGNSGNGNSGDSNSGDGNSGYRNSGSYNSGYRNSGDFNSGNGNSGDGNRGYRNSGGYNRGDGNSGNGNSGDSNSGDSNSGYRNSGSYNSGYRNSGDFNSGNYNSGNFCTKKSNDFIIIFNKESKMTWNEWYNHKACQISSHLSLVEWVIFDNMSEDEKTKYPNAEVCGGYLKTHTYHQAWANLWRKLSKDEKDSFKTLPNFDSQIFKEITGIDF